MQEKRTRWREAISEYICSTAPLSVTSRYSLYMLWYPLRLWCRTHSPKFLMVVGFFSKIWTSPQQQRQHSAFPPSPPNTLECRHMHCPACKCSSAVEASTACSSAHTRRAHNCALGLLQKNARLICLRAAKMDFEQKRPWLIAAEACPHWFRSGPMLSCPQPSLDHIQADWPVQYSTPYFQCLLFQQPSPLPPQYRCDHATVQVEMHEFPILSAASHPCLRPCVSSLLTSLMERIWPWDFFTFFNFLKKYLTRHSGRGFRPAHPHSKQQMPLPSRLDDQHFMDQNVTVQGQASG